MRKPFAFLSMIFLLTACWSNQEIDDEALVHGVGMDKAGDQYRFNVEIVKPGSQFGLSRTVEQKGGENIILDIESDSLLNGARELIRKAKRRLYFGHTRVWIVGEELAKENSLRLLDQIRRDQMNRINSYVFISEDDPRDILSTPTLYEELSAVEMVSALEQTKFISEYTPMTIYELFRRAEGPIKNVYIPMIKVAEEHGQMITELDGTAVIKNEKMVGRLTKDESIGLTWLLNQVKGGSITVKLDNDEERVALEISKTKTKIKPHLQGKDLDVGIDVRIEGTFADNITPFEPTRDFLKQIEEKIAKKIKKDIRDTLNKLQHDLKTDITEIGIKTYRNYPKAFRKIENEWDDVFADADISIRVQINIYHQGLIDKSIKQTDKKPTNLPFPFFK